MTSRWRQALLEEQFAAPPARQLSRALAYLEPITDLQAAANRRVLNEALGDDVDIAVDDPVPQNHGKGVA